MDMCLRVAYAARLAGTAAGRITAPTATLAALAALAAANAFSHLESANYPNTLFKG